MSKILPARALAAAVALVPSPVLAHHPGGTGNSSGGGPANTAPATTLEQGQIVPFAAYEYIGLYGLGDQDLVAAAGRHEHVHTIGSIQSTSFGAAFGATDDLTVSFRLPFVRRTDIREGHHSHGGGGAALNTIDRRGDAAGVGDMTLLGQWRFLHDRASNTEAALLFGVKLPTGRTNVRDRSGEVFDTEFQPGSGSVDPVVGMAVTQRFGAWSLHGNAIHVFVNNGAQHTNLGNRFQYNGAVSFRVLGSPAETASTIGAPTVYSHLGERHAAPTEKAHDHGPKPVRATGFTLAAVLELNGEWHDKQTISGVKDRNSGGNTVYLSPGLRASYLNGSAFVSVGVPMVNHVGGLQSKPSHRIVSGIALSF